MFRQFFPLFIFTLLASCASKHESESPVPAKPLTVEEEKYITREVLLEMRRDYPALQDAEVQNYVAMVGNKIVKANSLSGNPYEYSFTVVDAPTINAFALPAGKVFVTASLLRAIESEAELSGILSHEIAHVLAKHTTKRIEEQQKTKNESWWYGTGGAVAGGLAGVGATSLICPQGNVCIPNLWITGVAVGVSQGLLIQKYKFLANNRDNELEADRLGFKLALQAGYSSQHIGDFYVRLKENESKQTKNDSLFADAFKSHPSSEERLQQIQKLTSQADSQASPQISSQEFAKMKNRLNSVLAKTPTKTD